MSKIKRIIGLASIAILFIGAIFGIVAKESKLGNESKLVERKHTRVIGSDTVIAVETEQLQYICMEDFLEMDENDLAFKMYDNVEVVECMHVGCAIFN